jgi:phosphoribosyl 1,2-cyclic phosphodiesterase
MMRGMLVLPLQSGSNGNSIYVEAGDVRLLFDAGLSGIQLETRLARFGRSAAGLDALFISHDHSDHVRGAGVFVRKFGMPLYVTPRTLAVSKRRMQLGALAEVAHFRAGDRVRIRHVTVETVATPHDAVDGAVFVVDDGERRVGICTDLGHVFDDLRSLVASVDGLYLESNYDEGMLERGRYPYVLKKRIRGPGGHIANREAAELVARHATSRLQWLCLAHLSEENNTPELALATHRAALGDALPIVVARRYEATPPMTVAPRLGGALARAAAGDELVMPLSPFDILHVASRPSPSPLSVFREG